jgi:hypothetical protein
MFNDRFIITNPSLSTVDINTIKETDLPTLYPDLYNVVLMVRRHSVLLKRKTLAEIYNAVTEHADPRIGLVLAAARDPDGNQMFPDLSHARQFMFGTIATPPSTSPVRYQDRNIFVDGIERVAAALAASILIAQLAQLPEQANHANILEKQALDDLDRIITIPRAVNVDTEMVASDQRVAFLFSASEFFVPDTESVIVRIFMMSDGISYGWYTVGTYQGDLDTKMFVADISDTINTLTLGGSQQGQLVAAPLLDNNIHSIEVAARSRDAVVSYHTISIDISYYDAQGVRLPELPFTWGVINTELNPTWLKSALIKVEKGVTNSLSFDDLRMKNSMNVLYFRRALTNIDGELVSADGSLILEYDNVVRYRLNPAMEEPAKFKLNEDTPAELRPSEVAEGILQGMHNLHTKIGAVRGLGAIIRNDPLIKGTNPTVHPVVDQKLVALELVATTASIKEVWLILDVLDLPYDIEIALGNTIGPMTQFSNRPRSIRVEAFYDRDAKIEKIFEGLPKVIRGPKSELKQKVDDIKNDYEINRYYDSINHYLVQPPNLVNYKY